GLLPLDEAAVEPERQRAEAAVLRKVLGDPGPRGAERAGDAADQRLEEPRPGFGGRDFEDRSERRVLVDRGKGLPFGGRGHGGILADSNIGGHGIAGYCLLPSTPMQYKFVPPRT